MTKERIKNEKIEICYVIVTDGKYDINKWNEYNSKCR